MRQTRHDLSQCGGRENGRGEKGRGRGRREMQGVGHSMLSSREIVLVYDGPPIEKDMIRFEKLRLTTFLVFLGNLLQVASR